MSPFHLSLLCLSLSLGAAWLSPLAARAEPDETPRYVVEFRNRGDHPRTVRDAGGRPLLELRRRNLVAAKLSERARRLLARRADVASITIDPKRYPMAQRKPWGIRAVQADRRPVRVTDAANRTVCIIDSGYDLGHEDLRSSPGVTGDDDRFAGIWEDDGCGHGTHVAGTIAAVPNDIGVVGTTPGVGLHIVKVFGNSCRYEYSSTLVDALDRCLDAGAQVVNLSLGGPFPARFEQRAFDQAWAEGVLMIAAAGNSGGRSLSFPASYESVISVGALNERLRYVGFSQRNRFVELAAPGVDVLSTVPVAAGGPYQAWDGTSMAAPHVAGVAALVWSHNPRWTNEQVRRALAATALDLGPAGRDHRYGFGLVQANRALAWLNRRFP